MDRERLRIPKVEMKDKKVTTSSKLSELPSFEGGKTAGIFVVTGMEDVSLVSGVNGPSKNYKGVKIPGMDIVTKTHVEAHTSALMRMNNIAEATLYINNPPCNYIVNGKAKGCRNVLQNMLPEGAKLTVIGSNGYKQTFIGLPD